MGTYVIRKGTTRKEGLYWVGGKWMGTPPLPGCRYDRETSRRIARLSGGRVVIRRTKLERVIRKAHALVRAAAPILADHALSCDALEQLSGKEEADDSRELNAALANALAAWPPVDKLETPT